MSCNIRVSCISSVQFSRSVVSDSSQPHELQHAIAARQASLFITNSRSSLRLTSIKSVMPSSHLILCRPLLNTEKINKLKNLCYSRMWFGQWRARGLACSSVRGISFSLLYHLFIHYLFIFYLSPSIMNYGFKIYLWKINFLI